MGTLAPERASATDRHCTDARRNRLLAALPLACWQAWGPRSDLVSLHPPEALYEPGDQLRYVYFPVTSTIAVLQVLATGECMQIAMAGSEGLVGVGAFMGSSLVNARAVVQTPGTALRVAAEAVKEEFERGGEVMRLLLQYAQALMFQVSQTAVCNRHHNPRQQLGRWLLLCLDRTGTDEIVITHDVLGMMLGVRRETVTEAVRGLQAKGILRSGRGRITVLDRAALELSACECYRMVRNEYHALLGTRQSPTS